MTDSNNPWFFVEYGEMAGTESERIDALERCMLDMRKTVHRLADAVLQLAEATKGALEGGKHG